VGQITRAVGRVVVDDQHDEALGRRPAQSPQGGPHERLQVRDLVVGGDDEPGSTRFHEAAYPISLPPMADPTNTEIADALAELGDLYELDGAIIHRVVAYRTAAKSVREASTSVAALAREGRATELAGIGKTLQEKIVDLVEHRTIPAAERLRAQFPAGLIHMTHLPGLGPKRARMRTHTGMKVDLRVVAPEQFGNLLQHFTGSKQHNMALREAAVRRGLHVSEYGVLDEATEATLQCATEEEVYAALGLAYIAPE